MSEQLPNPRRPVLIRWVVAGVVGIAVIGATGAIAAVRTSPVASTGGVRLVQSDQAPPTSPAATMLQKVLPSVVNIRVLEVSTHGSGRTSEAAVEGSGVILSSNGVIVTNNHVVAGALEVSVVFTDGHPTMKGTVVGTDPLHDLAVVKVNATGLTPIVLGRSGGLELGDQVDAVGFPLGLGPTVTQGIVSGLSRSVAVRGPEGTEHLVGLLQTDAAINPGNSGGALVDGSGQLVGINTAAAEAGKAENVGFAIAVDEAVPVIRQIVTEPRARQAWLGVESVSVESSAAAAALGLPPGARGAAVVGVVPGSPAAAAGIHTGDVIVAVGGTAIRSGPDLTEALASLDPGQVVQIRLLVAGGTVTVDVRLTQQPPN